MFHRDQGAQFTSTEFTNRLEMAGIRISLDGRGRALDNVFVERRWRTVKYEEVYLKDYETPRQATRELGQYFAFYNEKRLHQALAYQTPAVVYFESSVSQAILIYASNCLDDGVHLKDPFLDIRLRLQFPYPIERSEIQNIERVEGIRFSPIGLDITVGGGAARVVQPPLTRVYEFQATQLRSEGRLDLLLLLNSWRDPRGKIIPPEEAPRYVVPELGPSITYIDGSYRVKIGEEEITKSFYAPIGLREDKTVILGPPGPRPDELSQEFGFQ